MAEKTISAWAVIARKEKTYWNKRGNKVVRHAHLPISLVHDDLGGSECMCSEPEEAYYVFKKKEDANMKAEYLHGYDNARVVRVQIKFKI